MTADIPQIPDSTADLLGLPEPVRQQVEDALQQVNPHGQNLADDPAVAEAYEIIKEAGLPWPKARLVQYVQDRILNILAGMSENHFG